jgi:hypothetical protein
VSTLNRAAAAGIDRDVAERAAERRHERELMPDIDLGRGDRHETGEVYGYGRSDQVLKEPSCGMLTFSFELMFAYL